MFESPATRSSEAAKKTLRNLILDYSHWDFDYYSYDWGTLSIVGLCPLKRYRGGACYLPFIVQDVVIKLGEWS